MPLARLRALRSWTDWERCADAQILRGLRDADARVRGCLVLLSERLTTKGIVSDFIWGQLRSHGG